MVLDGTEKVADGSRYVGYCNKRSDDCNLLIAKQQLARCDEQVGEYNERLNGCQRQTDTIAENKRADQLIAM